MHQLANVDVIAGDEVFRLCPRVLNPLLSKTYILVVILAMGHVYHSLANHYDGDNQYP